MRMPRTLARIRVRKVVCAACRAPEGLIVCGARHFDRVMLGQMASAGVGARELEQGFIDQGGAFLTREDAYRVAVDSGQVGAGTESLLISEDLY